MAAALKFDHVHKRFADVDALRGIDFEVERGSFFGLLGPNGAGKSTLINIAGGLVRPTSGRAAVLGHDVQTDYRRSRAAIGIVPQELVYDPFFTVREMLRLQAGYFSCPASVYRWVDTLIDTLELGGKANTRLNRLSGGMKRRVLVAQALVHQPEVVVLDEPTAGVDVELRKALWSFVSQLHDDGKTIILTTHYLEEAESLCERIAILNHGQVIALDEKQSLLARHSYRFLCLTVAQENPVVPESLRPLVVEQDGCCLTFRLHRDDDQIGGVIEAVRASGIDIVDLHTREPGLEEVFIGLTSDTPTPELVST